MATWRAESSILIGCCYWNRECDYIMFLFISAPVVSKGTRVLRYYGCGGVYFYLHYSAQVCFFKSFQLNSAAEEGYKR